MVVAVRRDGAVDLRAGRVVLVLVGAGIAACSSEASRACASAAGHKGARDSISVAVAVRRDSALDLGACRVVLILVGAGIAACTSEASRARASAAGYKGAGDNISVSMAVCRHSAVDLGARRVIFVLFSAGVAACTSEASRACASAAGHKGAGDNICVAVAVRRDGAVDLRASRVVLVLFSAVPTACTSETSRARASAAGNKGAGDNISVAVAVRRDGALDLRASRVVLVLVSALLAACTSETSRARASAAGHKGAGDNISVAVAVRRDGALDLGARCVVLILVGAGIAACASEASRACACAAGDEGSRDVVSMAVAVRRDGTLDLRASRVVLVLVSAGSTACISEAIRACASAPCYKCAGDSVSVVVAVFDLLARNFCAQRVKLVVVGAGLAGDSSESGVAGAGASGDQRAADLLCVPFAVDFVLARHF